MLPNKSDINEEEEKSHNTDSLYLHNIQQIKSLTMISKESPFISFDVDNSQVQVSSVRKVTQVPTNDQ